MNSSTEDIVGMKKKTYWHDNEEFPGEKYEDVYGNNE